VSVGSLCDSTCERQHTAIDRPARREPFLCACRAESKIDRVKLRMMLDACDVEPREQRTLLTACACLVERLSRADADVALEKLLGECGADLVCAADECGGRLCAVSCS
jgi:hypothetical protein